MEENFPAQILIRHDGKWFEAEAVSRQRKFVYGGTTPEKAVLGLLRNFKDGKNHRPLTAQQKAYANGKMAPK